MSGQRDHRTRVRRGLLALIGIGLVFSLGVAIGSRDRKPARGVEEQHAHAVGEVWTCSMHPQIQQDAPGQCPLCGMDLIPVEHESSGPVAAPRQLSLSPAARQLAEVVTAVVLRRPAEVEVPLAGKIRIAETRQATISAWVPGRIERLHISATGEQVHRGDPLVTLYSPELFTAHTELLQARNQVQRAAVRRKLWLWGLSEEQIARMERAPEPQTQFTIPAPSGGTVLAISADEGHYVQTGEALYTIADLTVVWAVLEAYESDLPFLGTGQAVALSVAAMPGQLFEGRITLIEPVLDAGTRTVRVRVELGNPQGLLKPEMLVHARVKSRLDRNGALRLNGPAEDAADPLVIPASAPLITGRRAVVYVEVSAGLYEGREVELGPRAGDLYVVRAGLSEGERVVAVGNFKIDSAMQIQARPSMMSMPGDGIGARPMPGEETLTAPGEIAAPGAVPASFLSALTPLYDAYFAVQAALSRDDLPGARRAATQFTESLGRIHAPPGGIAALWPQADRALRRVAGRCASAATLAQARAAFETFSLWIVWLVQSFGSATVEPILRYHCPMAFDWRGADWLQPKSGSENPYFGAAMFKCGDEVEVLWRGAAAHE